MPNPLLDIKTPRGTVMQVGGNGCAIKLQVEWSPGFGPDWTSHLQEAQSKFDAEVLRVTQPYVPYDTHMLQNTAIMGSDIGGGELDWITPYAGWQYYNTSDTRPYDSLAGAHWGDRMKADNLPHLEDFARKAVKR